MKSRLEIMACLLWCLILYDTSRQIGRALVGKPEQPKTGRMVISADKMTTLAEFERQPYDTVVHVIIIDGIQYYCTRVGDGIAIGPRVPQDAR